MRGIQLLAVLLMLGLLVAWWLDQGPQANGRAAEGGLGGPGQETASQPLAGTQPPEDPPAGSQTRRSLEGGQYLLSGRCVDAKSRALPGCEISAHGEGREQQTRSDELGHFALRLPKHGRGWLLRARHPSAAGIEVRLPAATDERHELGDLRLPTGTLLRGRVRDAQGAPVVGAALRFSFAARVARGQPRPARTERVLSDGQGMLALPHRLAAGPWSLSCEPPFLLVQPRLLELPEGMDELLQDIQVRRPDPADCISGRVRDATGKPVYCSIHAREAKGEALAFCVSQKGDGRFLLVRRQSSPRQPVQLAIRAHGFEAYESTPTPWGSSELEIRLQPSRDLAIRVLRADTGEPVTGYRAFWYTKYRPGAGGWPRGATQGTEHAGGEALIPKVPVGQAFIHVIPLDPKLCPSDPLAFAQPRPGVLDLLVEPSHSLRLKLSDRAGEPVVGSEVELLLQRGEARPSLDSRSMPPISRAMMSMDRWQNIDLRADQAKSDQAGRATLRWRRRPDEALFLRIKGSTHLPLLRPVQMQAGELRIELDRGCSLRGRIQPAESLAELRARSARCEIRLLPLELGGARPRELSIDAAGRFSASGLHPGRWRVELRATKDPRGHGHGFVLRHPEELLLSPGAPRELIFSLHGKSPASLRGQLRIDGQPRAHQRIRLAQLDGPHSADLRSDAQGRFRIDLCHAGRYLASVEHRDANGTRARLWLHSPLQLSPGPGLVADLQLRTASLRLELRGPDGQAAGARALALRAAGIPAAAAGDSRATTFCSTDAQGMASLPLLAAGIYDIYLRRGAAAGGDARIGQLRLSPGPNRHQLRLDRTR